MLHSRADATNAKIAQTISKRWRRLDCPKACRKHPDCDCILGPPTGSLIWCFVHAFERSGEMLAHNRHVFDARCERHMAPPSSSAVVRKRHMVVINQPAAVDIAAKRFHDPLDVPPEGIHGRGFRTGQRARVLLCRRPRG